MMRRCCSGPSPTSRIRRPIHQGNGTCEHQSDEPGCRNPPWSRTGPTIAHNTMQVSAPMTPDDQ